MNTWLLALIQCPITREDLHLVDASLLEKLQDQFRAGQLVNKLGIKVNEDFESGLVNASGTWFYAISDNIPSLIPEEAIPLCRH
jgi:uncharacterized protein YbaR (Trm112 family)